MLYVAYQHLSHYLFFIVTATTEIYTLSLHDALPILDLHAPLVEEQADSVAFRGADVGSRTPDRQHAPLNRNGRRRQLRSEEHRSELQSLRHLVCRLLLEKKKQDQPKEQGLVRYIKEL